MTRGADAGTLRARAHRLAFERGGLLILVIAAVYAWLTPAYFVDGENAEFSTLSELGGAAHPSGYPIYVLWLRAMSWLPGASPAHSAGLATAVLGVATCAVLGAACRAWGARPAATALTVAMFAAGPVVIRLHTEAEVFALNNLVVALVLWLSAERGPLRGTWRAVVLALIAGLGLSNHLTCALVAPVGVLGVLRGIREAPRPPLAVGALAVGGLLLGLSPYVYLLLAPDTAISWGQAHGLHDLVGFVTRRDYGGPFAFSPERAEIDVVANLVAFGRTVGRGWLWIPLLLGLGALFGRVVRAPVGGEPRVGWRMLAVTWLVAGPVLVARFNVEPTELGLLVCQRFHILPLLLLAIPVACGLDHAGALVLRRRGVVAQARATGEVAGAVVSWFAFIAIAGTALPQYVAINSPAVQTSVTNMLTSLPPDAVVISQSDLRSGVTYAQQLLGIRPDVILVTWKMVPMPWYVDRLAHRGLVIDPHDAGLDGPPSVKVAEQVLATGRPLFVDLFAGSVVKQYTTYPYGTLFRVLPRGAPQLPLDDILALNHRLFAAFELGYPRPGLHDGYPTGIHERYATTWGILARALSAANRPREAREALEIARELAPR